MRAQLVVRCVAALQVFLLLATLVLPALAAAGEPPVLTAARSGNNVTVTGTSFGADEAVDVTTSNASGTPVDVASAQADATGAFTYSFALASLDTGTYSVSGSQASGPSASVTFEGAPTPTDPPADPTPTTPPASEPDPTAPPAPDPTAAPTTTPTEPTYTPSGPPSIVSDKPDYAPGELVILTGANWLAAEIVTIYVNDDAGNTWNYGTIVSASATGTFMTSFNLPSWFVATYSVTATGSSGTATTSFTDGNIRIRSNTNLVTFTLTWAKFATTDCTGGSIDSGTESNVGFAGGARFTKGAGNTESIRMTASATSTQGGAFSNWSAVVGTDPFTVLTATSICIPGFSGNGTREYVANYAAGGSIEWEKRDDLNALLGGATFTVAPNPITGSATALTVVDNGANDLDPDPGQFKVSVVNEDKYTVTETIPPSGFVLDTDVTRVATVDLDDPNAVIGTQGANDAGTTDESDFHNRLGSLSWEKRTAVSTFPLLGGATFTLSPNPFSCYSGTDPGTIVDDVDGSTAAGDVDRDPLPGRFTIARVCLATYTITESSAPTGFAIDPDPTRIQSVPDTTPAGNLAAVVGTQGSDQAYTGTGDESDFHNPANAAPVANGQSVSTNEDTAIVITLSATDANGQNLTFAIVSGPSHGTLGSLGTPVCATVSGTWTCTSTVTYTPALNYNSSDGPESFTFRANDGFANSNTATVSITVNPVNDAPSFTKGADQTVNEDAGPQTVDPWATAISAGPANESGQTVSFVITANTNASLFSAGPAVSSTGVLTYTPAANANGTATITLKITDNGGVLNGGVDESLTQTFTITVNAVDDAPTAVADTATVLEDSGATAIDVLANDTDIDGGPKSVASVTQPANGTVLITGGGTGLTYAPNANYCNNGSPTDNFSYTLNGSSTATVSMTVTCVNDAPSFTKGADQTVNEDAGPQTVNPWATAISAGPANESGQTVSFVITANTNASLFSAGPAVSSTGVLTYTPAANANGSATITLKITDNGGVLNGGVDESATQTFVITVNPVNDAPVVVVSGDFTNAPEGSTRMYTYTVTDVDNDVTAPPFTVTESCGTGATYIDTAATNSFDCKFLDGPGSTTINVSADDGESVNNIGQNPHGVTIQNVAPTIAISGATSVNEGSLYSLTLGLVTDPGTDTVTSYIVHWGDGSSDTYTSAGVKTHTYADGPNDYAITVDLFDEDSDPLYHLNRANALSVHVNNVAPTASLANNGPKGEGSPVTVSFSGQFDPSTTDTAAGFHYAYACDNAAFGSTPYATAGIAWSTTCVYGDEGTYTVRARIIDKDGGYTEYQTTFAVTNVAPIDTGGTFTFNPYTGNASATIGFSDPGWLDTITSMFNWSGTLVAGTPASYGPTGGPGATTGTFSSSHSYAPGCFSSPVSVRVSDNDGGYFDHSYATSLNVYTVTWDAPIKDGVRNVVKKGNVIPVKLRITDCTGRAITDKTLNIRIVAGIVDAEDVDDGTQFIPDSVSGADTTGFMRQVDSKYMYNLDTKTLIVDMPYTIVVRDGTTLVATAVIQPKK